MSAIYIQHARNPAYFYGQDRWVLGLQSARRFATTHEAIAYCLEHDVIYAHVRVCFGPGTADVTIPVSRDMAVATRANADFVVWE
jgi:hypothetical protein